MSRYPVVGFFERDLEVEKEVDLMMAVVKQIRSLRGEYKLTNKQKTKAGSGNAVFPYFESFSSHNSWAINISFVVSF